MDTKQQLKEAIEWTKQAGSWLNYHQPSFAKFADPIMLRTAANLGYLTNVHEFVEATQAPPIIQTALYSAAGFGMVKWNKVVVSEINRGLNEYNSRQTSGNGFGFGTSLLLAGTASLAITTAVGNSDSQGTPFSSEQRVEYVDRELVQEPVNETFTEIILEPAHETSIIEEVKHPVFSEEEIDLSHLVEENFVPINFEDIETLGTQLEETFARQSLLERKLHPKAQKHYDRLSGRDYHRMIEKIERASQYDDLIETAAEKYDIPKEMMFSLILKESDGKLKARSHVGARGLMQIMPRTGKYVAKIMGDQFVELTGRSTFKTKDLYDPKINIEMGAFYLRFIHDHYGERILRKRGQMPNDYKEWTDEDVWDFTMGCYNRGPGGMTRNMLNAGADTFWDLRKGQSTDEVLRYVPWIRGAEKVYVEYLMEQAGISKDIARVLH